MRTDDGAQVAWRSVGDSPIDVLFVPWWWNNLESQWDDPLIGHFLGRIVEFSRLITFDMRGIGLSDPMPSDERPTPERWVADAIAVMDAAESERPFVVGHGDGGVVAMVLAAAHPQRCSGLVVVDGYARLAEDDGYDGFERHFLDGVLAAFADFWGSGDEEWVKAVAPSHAASTAFREQLARTERLSLSPGAAAAIQAVIGGVDIRSTLSTIKVKTLILHHRDNRYVPAQLGRYLAENIPDAAYVELAGGDHLYWAGDPDAELREIEQFVTGAPAAVRGERVLATVVFTDISASTKTAAELGDARWRQVLGRYDDLVSRELARLSGTLVKSTGDGSLVTFGSPARAVAFACAVRDGGPGLGVRLRAGLHTGEVEMTGSDIAGLAVHIAQRTCDAAKSGEVLVSRTVADLLAGSSIRLADRGEHTLKGIAAGWRLFSVET